MNNCVEYSPYRPTTEPDLCSICLDETSEKSLIAHDQFHPVHESCLRQWVAVKPTCPSCHAEIGDSIFWKERLVAQITKNYERIILIGAIFLFAMGVAICWMIAIELSVLEFNCMVWVAEKTSGVFAVVLGAIFLAAKSRLYIDLKREYNQWKDGRIYADENTKSLVGIALTILKINVMASVFISTAFFVEEDLALLAGYATHRLLDKYSDI